MATIEFLDFDQIFLDYNNPRISEFGVSKKTSEDKILSILWKEMAVNEIMQSIISNGFWQYEPLIIMPENDHYVVIEGNRRLAAVKLLHGAKGVDIPVSFLAKVTEKVLESTRHLPVIKVNNRSEAWKFVGFKHVNGPAKWGSYAKAKYLAEIHKNYDVSLEDIAYQIGDTNKTAQRLYQGLMVLEQGKSAGVFDYDDIQASRIYFSHLYTGLQRSGIKTFLNIQDADMELDAPVPEENISQLGELLEWLYGSKKNGTQPVFRSQNPGLRQLDEVVKSKEATAALRAGENLEYAYELSRANDALFEENLLAAKRGLQKARAYLTTGYKGEVETLKIAGTVANLAEDLYDEMNKEYVKQNTNKKKNRIAE